MSAGLLLLGLLFQNFESENVQEIKVNGCKTVVLWFTAYSLLHILLLIFVKRYNYYYVEILLYFFAKKLNLMFRFNALFLMMGYLYKRLSYPTVGYNSIARKRHTQSIKTIITWSSNIFITFSNYLVSWKSCNYHKTLYLHTIFYSKYKW